MDRNHEKMYCNCCGRQITTNPLNEREDYLDLSKEWGYFSRNKDGQVHRIRLCESCYDRWTAGFVIPVQMSEQSELL